MLEKLKNKNVLLAIIGVLLIGGTAVGGYCYVNRNELTSNPPDNSSTNGGNSTQSVIKPSGNYALHTSETFNRISFEYPENWILIPAETEDGTIIIRNFKEGKVDSYGKDALEVTISRTEKFGTESQSPSWVKIENNDVPTEDDKGNKVIKSQSFYTQQEKTLSLKQETEKKYITYIPFGHTVVYIKIIGTPKNSTYVAKYDSLINSFKHNVTTHVGI